MAVINCPPSSTLLVFNLPSVPARTSTVVRTLNPRLPSLVLRPSLSSNFSLSNAIPNSSRSAIGDISPPQSQTYVYPDPIPEFARSEVEKFRVELKKRLIGDEDTFGEELDSVVDTCAQILGQFLRKEYGGPGTLLVEPFTCMFVALNGRKLPGAPVAARAALLWAQKNIDQDWEAWNLQHSHTYRK